MNQTKIPWHSWTEEAFQKAKRLEKPILWDISAVWCHWCHVMHPFQVHIVGSAKDSSTGQFVHEALTVHNPLKTIEVLDPSSDIDRLKRLKYPAKERTIAYVCAEGKCTLAENAADLIKLMAYDP